MGRMKDIADLAYDLGYQTGFGSSDIVASPYPRESDEEDYWISGWEDGVHDRELQMKISAKRVGGEL